MVVEVRQHPVQEQRREDEGQEALAVQPLQRSASTLGAAVNQPRFAGGSDSQWPVSSRSSVGAAATPETSVIPPANGLPMMFSSSSQWYASGRLWRGSCRYRSVWRS